MRTIYIKMFFLKVIVVCIFLLFVNGVEAQQLLDSDGYASAYRYRVTAYKTGEAKIFSQSNIVEIIPPVSIYVPSAFTPNNDGLNDNFFAHTEGVVDFDIQIYNRWGEKIFESKDVDESWDGTYNSLVCTEDTYTYLIVARGIDGKRVKKTGSVTLIL